MDRPLPQVNMPQGSSPSSQSGIPLPCSPTTVGPILSQVEHQALIPAIYVHIPFCFHKCHYCDFYSLEDTQDRQAAFVDRLMNEMAEVHARLMGTKANNHTTPESVAPRSIFVGGGTPTLLRTDLWVQLLETMNTLFPFQSEAYEFTVEANPETVTAELADVLAQGGVNRVSVGCQSFNPVHLKTLERWHDPANVARAVEHFKQAGITNINLDLIFGIPGQSLADWENDLERALELQPTHLSCYALTFEPNTAMTARRNAGLVHEIDEDIEAQMFERTREMLREHHFDGYEISNFCKIADEKDALQDYRCQHNLMYWRNENWLAFGPSAAGHLNQWRWKNVPHLARYLEDGNGGGGGDDHALPMIQDVEFADTSMQLQERLLMGMRLREGLCERELLASADEIGCKESLQQVITQFMDSDQLHYVNDPADGADDENRHIAIPENALIFSDTIIAALMQAVTMTT